METAKAQQLYNQASEFASQGMHNQAIGILEDLLVEFPDEPKLEHAKAVCLAHLGKRSDAEALCEKVLREVDYAPATALLAQLRNYHPETPQGKSESNVEPVTRLSILSRLKYRRLARKLRSSNPNTNHQAATNLASLQDEHALNVLIAAIWSPTESTRRAAIHGLTQMKHPRAIAPLIAALKDPSPEVRRAAAETLGNLGDKHATPALVQALNDPGYHVSSVAACSLGKLGDQRAVDPLIDALWDESTRDQAAKALEMLGEPGWYKVISENKRHRCPILLRIHDPRALRPLLKILKHGKAEIAASVAKELGKTNDRRVIDSLILALREREPEVQAAAADALGELGDLRFDKHTTNAELNAIVCAKALEPLTLAAKNADPKVRREAITALGQLRDRRALDLLLNALKDTDEHVRARSAIALGFLGDCRAVNPLIELLDQRDVSADMAAHALGRLGDVRAVEPLLRVLSPTNAYNHLQVPAIDALVQLKAVHATELLIPLLADRHIDIAKRAATALAELGEPKWEKYVKGDKDDIERLGNCQDERIVAPLISALGSRYRERRNESARALAKLGQPQWLDLLTLRQDEYYRQLSGFGEIVVGAMLTALQEGDRKTRLTAVQALIQIAEKHPCYRERITQFRHDVARPHEDRSVGSSDCTHVDQGLGIQLPF